ncbi:DUF1616 domain-containing protein [Couchioplanes caeruleus]|uniref:DUF1616 domain-containing protein n=1 Tax=Couchioplanes caeruleus TaxID=56438 RepID=UPI0020BEB610|nr:DUF1616 domain-containing protein [Couchioplanes caeruleus]UQU68290.1 DUF1616 domain-containing protein [Couchioplanes caeruleus]
MTGTALLPRILAAVTVAAGAAVLAGPLPLTVAGGLLLGFVLPGMALTGALFRGRELTAVERITLAPALSMAVLVVSGLVIHVCRLHLDRVSWTVATAGVTLLALVVPALLPRAVPAGAPAAEDEPGPAAAPPPRLQLVPRDVAVIAEARTVVMSVVPPEDEEHLAAEEKARRGRLVRQLLPLVLVLAVLGGASWLSFGTSRETFQTTVTALSAAPSGPVDAAGNRTVAVSVSGLVRADGPYTLTVTGPAGASVARRVISVTGAGTWTESLSLPGAQRLAVTLFRAGDTTAYRTLYISAVE